MNKPLKLFFLMGLFTTAQVLGRLGGWQWQTTQWLDRSITSLLCVHLTSPVFAVSAGLPSSQTQPTCVWAASEHKWTSQKTSPNRATCTSASSVNGSSVHASHHTTMHGYIEATSDWLQARVSACVSVSLTPGSCVCMCQCVSDSRLVCLHVSVCLWLSSQHVEGNV